MEESGAENVWDGLAGTRTFMLVQIRLGSTWQDVRSQNLTNRFEERFRVHVNHQQPLEERQSEEIRARQLRETMTNRSGLDDDAFNKFSSLPCPTISS